MRYDTVSALHTLGDPFGWYALLQYKNVIKEDIFIKWMRWLMKVTRKKYWVHPLLQQKWSIHQFCFSHGTRMGQWNVYIILHRI